jgi:hypothetical protein
MTLPTSGVITFNDLKTEWADSNPVSLSEFYAGGTYLGANAIGAPSSGLIRLSNLYGMSNGWLNDYVTSTTSAFNDLALSSSGFLYLAGGYGTKDGAYAAKVNATTGAIVWQKYLADPSAFPYGVYDRVVLDSSENSYYIGETSTAYITAALSKYNSSGTLQWQYQIINNTIATTNQQGGIAVDSSNNIYIAFSTRITSRITVSVVAKFNSSLTLQWIKTLGYPSTNDSQATPVDLVLDTSGNVYVAGSETPATSSSYKIFVAKYDSSGNLQWVKTTTTAPQTAIGLSIDSSNNIYLTAKSVFTVFSSLFKIDTSGNLIWQRDISGVNMNSPSCDSSGNIYIGLGDTSGNGNGKFVKYNSSGVIQSESRLYTPSSGVTPIIGRSKVNSSNVPYLLFQGGFSTYQSFVKKSAVNSYLPATVNIAYPGSGSVYYTYSALSQSDAAGSQTWQNSSISDAGTPSISLSATSFVDTSGSSTLTKVNSAY